MAEPLEHEPAVELIIQARARPVGNVSVARLLPVAERRQVGPFLFLDHMGPVSFAPGSGLDVPPHPHIGLSTVTYLFEGEVLHRDSLGSVQAIQPGAVNLMTAGKGVVHSERSEPAFRASGGTVHGAQLWLALPTECEQDEPSFAHQPADSFPMLEKNGARVRVLMGHALGHASPLEHPSHPLFLDVELGEKAPLAFVLLDQRLAIHEEPTSERDERAIFVVSGELEFADHVYSSNQLLVLNPDEPIIVRGKTACRFLLIGGPKLDGPRFIDWNFVSSSKARIEQAKADWIARKFPLVPGDELEFVPLHQSR